MTLEMAGTLAGNHHKGHRESDTIYLLCNNNLKRSKINHKLAEDS